MNPAICARHGLIGPVFLEQGIEAGIPVDLENTGIARQVSARMPLRTLTLLKLPDPFAQLVGVDTMLQRKPRHRYARLEARLDQP